jgi:hypothetical protein
MLDDKKIKEIADTFYHFDDFFTDLKAANWDIEATRAKGEPYMVDWLLEYLVRQEKFEEAAELKNNLKNL